jgi:hypothetical protein
MSQENIRGRQIYFQQFPPIQFVKPAANSRKSYGHPKPGYCGSEDDRLRQDFEKADYSGLPAGLIGMITCIVLTTVSVTIWICLFDGTLMYLRIH